MANRLVIESDTLTPGLRAFPEKLNAAVANTIDYFSPQVEAYGRSNAPWTDRTGNARSGLSATPIHEGNTRHAIEFSHSVPYGIWLEVRFEGKYAIILPTIEHMGQELMGVMRTLFARMR